KFDRNVDGLGRRKAVVAGPFEAQRAAFACNGEKGQERIGGDGRKKLGAKNLLSIIFADELGGDIARNRLAGAVGGKARVLGMGDQSVEMEEWGGGGGGGRSDEGARHAQLPSRHAASVTTTSTSSAQNEPSLICATATTFCVSARRMRVEKLARPARGPRRAPI